MGLGFVLLVWIVICAVVALMGGTVFAGIAAHCTRRQKQGRRLVILAAALLPTITLGWAGIIFVLDGFVNETRLHRDFGIGDSWKCPLPNGYSILMIDVTDYGWVRPTPGVAGRGGPEVSGVRELQVAGHFILGGRDTGTMPDVGGNPSEVSSYFVLDTASGVRTDFPDLEGLRRHAAQLGIAFRLEPIQTVYSRYRYTPLDTVAAALAIGIPLFLAGLLVWWIVRIRRRPVQPAGSP